MRARPKRAAILVLASLFESPIVKLSAPSLAGGRLTKSSVVSVSKETYKIDLLASLFATPIVKLSAPSLAGGRLTQTKSSVVSNVAGGQLTPKKIE